MDRSFTLCSLDHAFIGSIRLFVYFLANMYSRPSKRGRIQTYWRLIVVCEERGQIFPKCKPTFTCPSMNDLQT